MRRFVDIWLIGYWQKQPLLILPLYEKLTWARWFLEKKCISICFFWTPFIDLGTVRIIASFSFPPLRRHRADPFFLIYFYSSCKIRRVNSFMTTAISGFTVCQVICCDIWFLLFLIQMCGVLWCSNGRFQPTECRIINDEKTHICKQWSHHGRHLRSVWMFSWMLLLYKKWPVIIQDKRLKWFLL